MCYRLQPLYMMEDLGEILVGLMRHLSDNILMTGLMKTETSLMGNFEELLQSDGVTLTLNHFVVQLAAELCFGS